MKYICTENYEINVGENVVEAVSKEYIPFDPKDWRKDFRDNLRQVLKDTLSADAHSKLFASYSGPSVGVADLDNILFYNIRKTMTFIDLIGCVKMCEILRFEKRIGTTLRNSSSLQYIYHKS